jgi:hypothetical protein
MSEENDRKAGEIVSKVLDSLNGRKGFDALWDEIDYEIREDILQELKGIVLDCLET